MSMIGMCEDCAKKDGCRFFGFIEVEECDEYEKKNND